MPFAIPEDMVRIHPLSFDSISKYDRPAPRYTSYPPATSFEPYDSAARYAALLADADRRDPSHVSLYFHVPFCPHRCLFCGCHTEIGTPAGTVKAYLDSLAREMEAMARRVDPRRKVTQIHFGGGTPNAMPLDRLRGLMERVRRQWFLANDAEIAIECDPSLLDQGRIEALASMGFNRMSFGVQDFRTQVLQAVERRVPRIPIAELVACAHDAGVASVNLDLIYGLPYQTAESFEATLETAVAAGADRVSVFGYAHVPWVKGHQSALEAHPMPDARMRLEIALATRRFFRESGFEPIGMDHFVKPTDELARAKAAGRLHRNFQGYCSLRHTGQVYAFGASAISQFARGYGQNLKDLGAYMGAVERGEFPLEKIYRMDGNEALVKAAIDALMCYGRVDFAAVCAGSDLPAEAMGEYIRGCRERMEPMLAEGWVAWENGILELAEEGWLFVRQAAAALDPLSAKAPAGRFSKAI
jgi:oxygen-independent coproporphyrinogen-3 oxidase